MTRSRGVLPGTFLLGLLAGLVVGCSTTREVVDRRMVLPTGADRHQVDDNQQFLMAIPVDQPMPEFPRGARVADGVHEVCVDFVVTEEGLVEQVAFPPGAADCGQPTSDLASFQASVADALSRWSFVGAAICTFPDGVPKDDKCEAKGAVIRAVPIRLRYVFSFEQVGGRRFVAFE